MRAYVAPGERRRRRRRLRRRTAKGPNRVQEASAVERLRVRVLSARKVIRLGGYKGRITKSTLWFCLFRHRTLAVVETVPPFTVE